MCRLFLVTVACLAILFGLSGLYMMPKLIQKKIEQRLQLKIGTKTYDRFTKVPIALKVKYYFFNVTNGDQVLKGLERPRFQEVGPFMFEQWRRRSVVDILDNNRKIIYKEYKTFYSMWPYPRPGPNETAESLGQPRVHYLAEEPNEAGSNPADQASGGPNQETRANLMLNPYAHNLTVINLPLLSVLTKIAGLEDGTMKRRLAALAVGRLIKGGGEKLLVTRPANELLFDGYKVGLLEAADELLSTTLGFNFESPLPGNKFGFFHGKNGTWSRDEAGEITIFTGRNESMGDFMQVDNWNGLRELSVWPKNTVGGNRCNQIRGTDGSQHHPGVTRDQVLDIFSPMICTSIQIKYREDTNCKGIPLLRFGTGPDMFAAPKKTPRNACYCTIKSHQSRDAQVMEQPANSGTSLSTNQRHQNRTLAYRSNLTSAKARITDSRCYLDGLLDLSLCQKGAPVAASAPHFLGGDPMLAHVAGLAPRKELHETYMDIEPMTGAVMRAASRAQLNAFVEQAALEVVEPDLIGYMTPMVAPMIWFEEGAEIDNKSTREFKGQLLGTVEKAKRACYSAVLFGFLLLLVVGVQYWYATCYMIDTSAARRRRRSAAKGAGSSSSRPSSAGGQQRRRRRPQSGPRAERQAGAKRANLATRNSKRLLIERSRDDQDGAKQQQRQLVGTKSASRAAAAAVAVAAAMGAADAASGRHQQLPRSDRRPPRASGAHDEDELSLRGLVENEWDPPGDSPGQTTAASSSNASATENDLKPSTSNQTEAEASTYDRRSSSPQDSPQDSSGSQTDSD